jgi:Fe-Mn family superoxide dismutase
MRRDDSPTIDAAGLYILPPLPYAQRALVPVISARTVRFHYEKHHKGYVEKLNTLVAEEGLQHVPLVELIRRTHGDVGRAQIFNNAAQVWNHNFYWQCLKPTSRVTGSDPTDALARMINDSFGSFDALKTELIDQAMTQFASGWVWLVRNADGLTVVKTGNAEVPFTNGHVPLLTIDVWEHAYYLDYQNRREEHVTAVISELLNWNFAAENLTRLDGLPGA